MGHPRPRPALEQVAAAVEILRKAKKPLIISGGGVRYSGAEDALAAFAKKRGIPMAETIAGKGAVCHDNAVYVGAMGIEGTEAARHCAESADVVLAIGTRLQDFTTGSWTAFPKNARFIHINAARFDASKHRAVAVVGDALESLNALDAALGTWTAPPARMSEAQRGIRNGTRSWMRDKPPPINNTQATHKWSGSSIGWQSPKM